MKLSSKYVKIILWIIVMISVLGLYQTHKEWFSISFLQAYVTDYKILVMFIYVLILSLLGLFFIPSTPFAIAGVVLFSPLQAYFLNILGILTSTTIVYHFSQYLGLNKVFQEKFPKKIPIITKKLKHRELPLIAGWSFFPIVPTDLIIYVASGLKIKLWKCLLGVSIGEGTLNLLYIFSLDLIIA